MNKIHALAVYLEIEPKDIQYKKWEDDKYSEYRTEKGTFLVMTEEEATEGVRDEIENFIDDLGIEGFTPEFQQWILDNALDDEPFEEFCKEDYLNYAEDIEYEEDEQYGNRLNRECIEAGLINKSSIVNGKYTGDDDLYELLSDHIIEDIKNSYSSFYEWFAFEFGKEVNRFIKENNVELDYDMITDEAIQWEDYGHYLARYDCATIELEDDLYAFLQDDIDERELD